MKNQFIIEKIASQLKPSEYLISGSFQYNSLMEEAIKLSLNKEKMLVVKDNSYHAMQLYECLRSFVEDEDLILYVPEESLRSEAIIASYENKVNRLKALHELLIGKARIIITSAYGLVRHLPKQEFLRSKIKIIQVGDTINRQNLIDHLKKSGYEMRLKCDSPLVYSVRGSILDVFSVNYEHPIRIEFWDDEVDSIRFFDVDTNKTIEQTNQVLIGFASDVLFDEQSIQELNETLQNNQSAEIDLDLSYIEAGLGYSSLYPYFACLNNQHLSDYCQDYVLYLSSHESNKTKLKHIFEENIAYIQEMASEQKLPLKFHLMGEYDQEIKKLDVYYASPFQQAYPILETIELPIHTLGQIVQVIARSDSRYKLIVIEDSEAIELIKTLQEQQIPYHIFDQELKEGINIDFANLYQGFRVEKLDLTVYSAKEIFNHQKFLGRYNKAYLEAATISSYQELKPGDYVVHNNYGVGQYLGIFKKEVNGMISDYLTIAYKGNDQLAVPINQFSLVRKYVSKEGYTPKLHKLGSKEWSNTKAKVQESVDEIAEKLIELYQLRSQSTGFAFEKDNEIQQEFEASFIYDLTPDQKQALQEVKQDMESTKVMDRLLCGDVGFGKTEVALRASMKAVLSLKQVAYLCPTTILSLQHYNTFKRRFDAFGVRIELLNRYVTASEQKRVIDDYNQGKVDVLIGTHRLLTSDLKHDQLGLLIIDEEQRFGVLHKEKIKSLKQNVDVLSLSATPIPRTLQMSLVGIRSLSTLNKAPMNRYPVATYVVEKNDALIQEAIMKELARNGQVFYLFNHTERIHGVAKKIAKAIPSARIAVAHGKMNKEDIEDVMQDFYLGKINVLVCTTIVETGLDIPNANTIIIENAQNFGLSQLYQIKGRVGRSNQIAYAYLLVPKLKQLNETSQKRLEAIKEFTSLGSGYKIAMRDLTIRGAGDLLGENQSGFIDSVGFDLYLSMLNQAIKTKQGEITEEPTKPFVQVDVESYIPEEFSENDYEKLDIYQRLDKIDNKKDLLQYHLDIVDEYGKLPKEVEALINKKKIELLMKLDYLHSFKLIKNKYYAQISEDKSSSVDGQKLFQYCNQLSKDFDIQYKNKRLHFAIINTKDNLKKLIQLIEYIETIDKKEWI